MTEQTPVFYTVFYNEPGFSVRYIDAATSQVKTFRGPFDDPGEASQEFKACIGHEQSWYLDEQTFREKVTALAQQKERQ